MSISLKINVRCQTADGRGVTYVDPLRIEIEDDGSLTVVVDAWPNVAVPDLAARLGVTPLQLALVLRCHFKAAAATLSSTEALALANASDEADLLDSLAEAKRRYPDAFND